MTYLTHKRFHHLLGPISRVVAALTASLMLLLAACTTAPPADLPTVPTVDLNRYVGAWYEIALLPNRFQAMCTADTQAEYRQDGDVIRVRNRCRRADGGIEEANGVAKVVEGSGNARLRVSFFRPFYGDYWILALDPDYRWVLVGEPSRRYGWVLARTPTLEEGTVRQILARAEALGYTAGAFQRSAQAQPLPQQ